MQTIHIYWISEEEIAAKSLNNFQVQFETYLSCCAHHQGAGCYYTAPRPTGQRPVCFKSSGNRQCQVHLLADITGTRTLTMMQRTLLSRGGLLVQQAAAALDSPLAARSAPLLSRLDRSMSSVTIPPPPCMLRPLEAPLRYLFGPGPSNIPPRILAAGGRPIIGHLHAEMYEVTTWQNRM